MKISHRPSPLLVTIVNDINLDAREASFLRVMAEHCVATEMPGSLACERLIQVLDLANVPKYDNGPVYGVFELPEVFEK